MTLRRLHLDRFDSAEHLRGKTRTYKAVKEAVVAAGRFSIFEATATAADARLFTRLSRDPGLVVTRDDGYPWITVKMAEPQEAAPEKDAPDVPPT